jgi:Uma2 family endonuclease
MTAAIQYDLVPEDEYLRSEEDSDTTIRTGRQSVTCSYYPDISVICGEQDDDAHFFDNPIGIVEVMPDSTRRIDEGEKKDAYLSLETLDAYRLISQDESAVFVDRCFESGFERKIKTPPSDIIALPKIGASLLLSNIYKNITL